MIAHAPGAASAASAHPFFGRRAVIASKHGKERALYAPLRERLGMFPEVLLLDTDRFGTFTGDVERTGSQIDALRAKLRAAHEETAYDAVFVASEGSFFPDPTFPQATLNRELVGIYDPRSGLEIIGSAVGPAAHVASLAIANDDDLAAALNRFDLATHAAVIFDGERYHKGLRDRARICAIVDEARARGAIARIEVDLRAHVHPTRMERIAAAAHDAVTRALSRCPGCSRPGYWCTERIAGLPCNDCGEPTSRTRIEVWSCDGCTLREERPSVLTSASPAHCDGCNP